MSLAATRINGDLRLDRGWTKPREPSVTSHKLVEKRVRNLAGGSR